VGEDTTRIVAFPYGLAHCREPNKKLSAKNALPRAKLKTPGKEKTFSKRLLCREPTKKLSAKKKALDTYFFAES
jgi:hypothetical protein